MTLRLLIVAALALYFMATHAQAHDVWANGQKVPDWVKSTCCGPADVHHLRPDQVQGPMKGANGEWVYLVEGYPEPIPAERALPSQDGDFWVFYKKDRDEHTGKEYFSSVYCFFVPLSG